MEKKDSKIARFLVSVIPLLFLTGMVVYYISNYQGLADLQKPEKKSPFKIQNPAPAAGTAAVQPANDTTYSPGIQLTGEDAFKERMTQAMKLIWLYDRDTFHMIRTYVYEIREENRTTFYFDEGKPVVAVSYDHAFRSPSWAAGVLAHNAWHAFYETSKKAGKKTAVPPPDKNKFFADDTFINPLAGMNGKFSDYLETEQKACDFQIKVLKEIGAPKSEIREILNRDPKDFSAGHDGEYSVKP